MISPPTNTTTGVSCSLDSTGVAAIERAIQKQSAFQAPAASYMVLQWMDEFEEAAQAMHEDIKSERSPQYPPQALEAIRSGFSEVLSCIAEVAFHQQLPGPIDPYFAMDVTRDGRLSITFELNRVTDPIFLLFDRKGLPVG